MNKESKLEIRYIIIKWHLQSWLTHINILHSFDMLHTVSWLCCMLILGCHRLDVITTDSCFFFPFLWTAITRHKVYTSGVFYILLLLLLLFLRNLIYAKSNEMRIQFFIYCFCFRIIYCLEFEKWILYSRYLSSLIEFHRSLWFCLKQYNDVSDGIACTKF